MKKSGYREGLYYKDNFHIGTDEVEQQIRRLLSENHGVGIIGGYYEPGYPFCMVSELTLDMLGYDSAEEFESATGNCMAGLLMDKEYLNHKPAVPSKVYELYLKGKYNNLWVRIVSHDVTVSTGEKLWIASVCDMDALFKKDMQVTRIMLDSERRELTHRKELKQANNELERQKQALERALKDAELNNEIISAIGNIYWQIYRLDILKGTFERIYIKNDNHHLTGDSGVTSERFPEACRHTVSKEYMNTMLTFLEDSTLAERLGSRDEISMEYQTVTGNWHMGRFIVQKRDDSGRAIGVLYTIQIINEQKEREMAYERKLAGIAEEAQRASLSKTDFLRRMSHDIRTPLNGIRGMIEIANHFSDDLNKQKECRDKVWEASGYLLSLVNSVLDMNKLESGSVMLEDVSFDLIRLLKETDIIAEMQAAEHGVKYIIDHEQSYIQHSNLIGSMPHLKQILINIVGNAIKYNKENGSVTVWCREISCDGKDVVFRFVCKDTGIGMSEEFKKRAFEPFTQEGKNNARTHYDGSGLGLSIVQALVKQMQGTICFESEEGIGTTFYITIPFKIDNNAAVKSDSCADEPISLNGVRILLAEDNELNMEIERFFTEQSGAIVTPAVNGREAVDIFSASEPGYFDLILMDVMMPKMNGYEATKAIRGLNRADAASIPIIAMSANAFLDDVKKSKAVGMNDHLPKPISIEKLLSTIRKYI